MSNETKNSRFTIVESVGTKIESVKEYSDIERHHPSSKEASNRVYTTIDGQREEVNKRHPNLIVKDFILQSNGSANINIPSPAAGYAQVSSSNGIVAIYSKPNGQGELLARVLHMNNFKVKSNEEVGYGQPLGQQNGIGVDGKKAYGIHAHVELPLDKFKQYISDISQGRITPDKWPDQQVINKDDIIEQNISILERNAAPVIRSGMKGNDVKELQEFLTFNGYDTHGVDGIFGKNTQIALENFQREHNLQVDGIFGKNTQAELSKISLDKNQPELIASSSSEKIQQVLEAMQKVDDLSKNLTPDERKNLDKKVESLALEGGVHFMPAPKEQVASTSEVLFNIVGAVGKGLSNSLNRDWALVGGMIGAVAEWGNSLRNDIKLGMDSNRGPIMMVGGHVHSMDFHKVKGMNHYANSDNKLLGKLDEASDKFEIFHRNGAKLDPIGTIENFSQQNQITLQDQVQQKVGVIGRAVEGVV